MGKRIINKTVHKLVFISKPTMKKSSSKKQIYRQKNPKNKHTKVHLVFDEESRKEYLTGFRKRKLQRKKKALEIQELKEKEDRRLKRQERKKMLDENLKNIKLPELNKEEQDVDPVVYQHPDHTVTVTSVVQMDLLADHGSVGENKVEYESDYYDDEPTKKPNPKELIEADLDEKRKKKKKMAAMKKSLGKKKIKQKQAREQKSQNKKISGFEKRRMAKKQLKRSGKNR